MTGNKNGMSLDQHCDVGEKLKSIREDMFALLPVLHASYSKSSREGKAVAHMIEALDSCRSQLDEAVFRENPGQDVGGAYYGDRASGEIITDK